MIEVKKEEFEAAAVKQIRMKIDYADLSVQISENLDHIMLEIQKEEDDIYQSRLQGGVLKIRNQWKKKWRMDNCHKSRMKLWLPAHKHLELFKLELGAGNAKIDGLNLSCEKMSLETGAGNIIAGGLQINGVLKTEIGAGTITLNGIRAEELYSECGMGDFTMRGQVQRKVKVECGMGKCHIDLEGKEDDYNYDIACGLGKIRVNGNLLNQIGTIQKSFNPQTTGEIYLSCGMGDVALNIA